MVNFVDMNFSLIGISLWILTYFAHIIDGRRPYDVRRVQFLPMQRSLTVHRGETVLLPCAVINLGANKVTWRKLPFITPITTGSSLFAQDTRFQAVYKPWKNEWSLSIKNVQLHDAGVYECQISLKKNSLRQNITLTVIDSILHRKAAIKITGDTFLNQGETLFLLCTANGIKYIPDDIQWFREGEPMATDYTRINIKEHVAHNAGIITSSIEIRHTSSDDGGTYVCRASSRTESLNIIASVKVHILLAQSKPFPSKRGTNNEAAHNYNSNRDRNHALSFKNIYCVLYVTLMTNLLYLALI